MSSLPEDYVVSDVWEFKEQQGMLGQMNKPTAGARHEQELPKGRHDLQLYSLGTQNGNKVTILLEELNDLKDVEYDAWKMDIFKLDQFGSEFVQANPNSKIPVLLDYSYDPPIRVFESGNILKYIAEKHDAFVPKDIRSMTECYNWLFWLQGAAPFIGGGFAHFYKFAPIKIQYAIDRYALETKRLLDVLDRHLAGKEYVCGVEYSIADICIWPWVFCTIKIYCAGDFLQIQQYTNMMEWFERVGARPAVKRGVRVSGFFEDAIEDRHSKADFDKIK